MDNQQLELQKRLMLEGIDDIHQALEQKRFKISDELLHKVVTELYIHPKSYFVDNYNIPMSILNKITRNLKDIYSKLPLPSGIKIIPLNSPFKYGAAKEGYIISLDSRKVMSNLKKTKGYRQTAVTKYADDGSGRLVKNLATHRLVCMAYHPNPFNLPQVNHIDGDKTNNHYTNLEWCSNKENNEHAWKTGLITSECVPRGINHGNSKFLLEDIEYIRNNYSALGIKVLAEKFNVHKETIRRVVNFKSYK